MVATRPGLCRSMLVVPAFIALGAVAAVAADSADPYPETRAVLSSVFDGEVRARIGYDACSRQALSEGYPNIAYLFSSLSASEAIHADNFRRILSALGTEVGHLYAFPVAGGMTLLRMPRVSIRVSAYGMSGTIERSIRSSPVVGPWK